MLPNFLPPEATAFFFKILFIYFHFCSCWVFRCSFKGFLQLRQAGATLCCGAWASHCCGFSCCRASVIGCVGFSSCDSQALELRHSSGGALGLVALCYVGSSRTRDQTHVSCIARQIPNHCTTREVSLFFLLLFFFNTFFIFSKILIYKNLTRNLTHSENTGFHQSLQVANIRLGWSLQLLGKRLWRTQDSRTNFFLQAPRL